MSEKCRKPGCGAARIPGHPCSDGDCPQQWVHHEEHRAIIKSFGARGAVFDRGAENDAMAKIHRDMLARPTLRPNP